MKGGRDPWKSGIAQSARKMSLHDPSVCDDPARCRPSRDSTHGKESRVKPSPAPCPRGIMPVFKVDLDGLSADQALVILKANFAVDEMLADAEIDYEGHFGMKGKAIEGEHGASCLANWRKEVLQRTRTFHGLGFQTRNNPTLLKAIQAREAFEPLPITSWMTGLRHCAECGSPIELTFDGKTLRFTSGKGPCQIPESLKRGYSVEIKIPSGKIVFANDLRRFYPPIKVDVPLGQQNRAITEAYAVLNLGHAFVGNTSPGIFCVAPTQFVIGTRGPDENPRQAERIGSICTDLWWYSIGDLQELMDRGYQPDFRWDTYADVPAGTYRITHLYEGLDPDDGNAPQDYATIEFVGE